MSGDAVRGSVSSRRSRWTPSSIGGWPPDNGPPSQRGIGGDAVFRLEAVAVVLVVFWILVAGSRIAWASAFLVLASALVAVLLYRYVPVPQLGPIPSMYEPIWFPEETVSAVAEGIGAPLAAVGFAVSARPAPRAGG